MAQIRIAELTIKVRAVSQVVQAVPLLYLWIQYRIPEYELW